MTNLGITTFEVLPEFKKFEQELVSGVTDAAKRAASSAPPIDLPFNTDKIESGLSRVGDLARVVAGTALVVGFTQAIEKGAEYASAIRGVSAVTGESVEDTSRLVFVLDRVGVNTALASRSFVIFNKNLADGSKGVKQYFTDAEIAELRTQTFTEQLATLSDEFQALPKGAARTNFLRDLFGRGGIEIGKVLSLTRGELKALGDEAERFGLILTAENAASFKDYTQSTRALQQSFKGLQVEVGLLTIPVLEKLNGVATKAVTLLSNAPSVVQAAAGVFAVGAIGIGKYGQAIEAVVNVGGKAIGALKRIGQARVVETAATTVSTGAILAEIAAHRAATGAVLSHAEAEALLTRAHGASAVSGIASRAAGLGVIGAAVAAAAIGTAAVIAFFKAAQDRARNAADEIASNAGPEIVDQLEAIQKKREELERRQQKLEDEGDAKRALRAGPSLGPPGAGFDPISPTATDEVARLQREIEELTKKEEALLDVERALRGETEDTADARREHADAIKANAIDLELIAEAAAAEKDAQEDLNEALRGVVPDSEAAINAQAEYAQRIIEVRTAIAEASGEQLDAAASDKIRQEALQAARDAVEDFAEAEKKAAEEARTRIRQIDDAFSNLADTIADAEQRVDDAEHNLAEAIEQGQERIADAHRAVSDAVEDRAEREADARERIADAEEDRTERIAEAEEDLADARKSAAEARAEAEEAVEEARKSAAEEFREAETRIRDFRVDAAKRVDEAERRLADARTARARALFSAQQSLTAALVSGDAEAENRARLEMAEAKRSKDVADAERGLAESKQEREEGLAKLEAELFKTRVEGRERVMEAEKNLAETIEENTERVADAQKALAKTVRDTNRAVAEAQENLVKSLEEADRRIADSRRRLADAQEEAAKREADARRDLARAQKDATKAVEDARQRIIDLAFDIDESVDSWDEATAAIKDYREELLRLELDENRRAAQAAAAGQGPAIQIRGFQHGGRHGPGFRVVGEHGPEVDFSDTPGHIASAWDFQRLLRAFENGGGRGEGGVTFMKGAIVVQEVAGDAMATARATSRLVARRVGRR